ncbi:TIGR02391 family protein [Nocardiopsis sp. EMB25]|uniref:TIGR02391 family protein n=1 Tax=Nocardiopsis sp. EMB25 TaxID=2835867 RepID=UPI0022851822|nr:TIGR02391 family protein [Nocardiopsis sp. EMB25]MCY9787923.1 TIGR02391 family protein [Nocardiopsis sp. EMB25]
MDVEWAITKLDRFLNLARLSLPPAGSFEFSDRMVNTGRPEAIVHAAPVVEQIIDRVIPDWRITVSDYQNVNVNRWCQHIEAAQRARALLLDQEEIREKLGENAPDLNAATLHPWAWQGARSLWESGHYQEAVAAAARKINAETQNKVDRKDITETALFKECFSTDEPKPGKPRLRVMPDDGSSTYKSVQRGVMAFAEGCFAAIRNPAAHLDGQDELTESEALEQLAAFSVLARWVDAASTEQA